MLKDLGVRVASAVVLGVPFILSVHAGAPYFDWWIIAAAPLLAWEWYRLIASDDGRFGVRGVIYVLCAAMPVVAASLFAPAAALPVIAAAALGILVSAQGSPWLAGGIVYLTAPCVALLWLRYDVQGGRETVFWLIAVVWASDIGAYFAGRLIGGPKLAPAISPNKTWAGVAGGAAAALVVGVFAALLTAGHALALLASVSVLLSVFAQAGDLVESWLKRRFGAKDTSALIPGHGGVLDRVDGLMTAATLWALIVVASKGSMLPWL